MQKIKRKEIIDFMQKQGLDPVFKTQDKKLGKPQTITADSLLGGFVIINFIHQKNNTEYALVIGKDFCKVVLAKKLQNNQNADVKGRDFSLSWSTWLKTNKPEMYHQCMQADVAPTTSL